MSLARPELEFAIEVGQCLASEMNCPMNIGSPSGQQDVLS